MATLGRRDTGAVVGRGAVAASGALMCLMEEVFAASVRTLVAPVTRRTSASIRSCRPCPLREQCQWQGYATKKPRQVSMLLHPLTVGVASLLWHDWSQRQPRRACMQLHSVLMEPTPLPNSGGLSCAPLPCASFAHERLSFQEWLVRNAHAPTTDQVTI